MPQSVIKGEATTASFEVASVKPHKAEDGSMHIYNKDGIFSAAGVSGKSLVQMAFQVKSFQVQGGPSWVDARTFDVEAKSGSDPRALSEPARQQLLADMVRELLIQRFSFKYHETSKEVATYSLVFVKAGPGLKPSAEVEPAATPNQPGEAFTGPGTLQTHDGQLTGNAITLAALASQLSGQLQFPVVDTTHLTGRYDVRLQWSPDNDSPQLDSGKGPENSDPPLSVALQEQLGLKLQKGKGAVKVVVIDQLSMPSAN